MLDAGDNAGAVGTDFEIDFFRFELDQRIAGRHLIALLLQPLGDAGFDDGFSELGDNDISGHNRKSFYLDTSAATSERPSGPLNLFG